MTDKIDKMHLEDISSPDDLRRMSTAELTPLAAELREFIIKSLSDTGGHLSASLGTIELTIALHYVFDTPVDNLTWDVGHQTYAHKILTGRREAMSSLRQSGGLAGFTKRDESEYDDFGAGHSSTSISAALGMAVAAKQQNTDKQSIAVIGDAAISSGMAFEALNHAGDMDANLLVVLNDNDMSISKNVGALSNHLARVLSGRFYSKVRAGSKKVMGVVPSIWELARRTEEHVKGMMMPSTFFEELGFNYIGPIDGHDIPTLIKTLRNLKHLKGPRLLHVVTTKGKGFKPAEEEPTTYHGVGKFHPESGVMNKSKSSTPTYTQVFGQWLCDMAAKDERLVAITPAMCEGSGMVEYSNQFPERYFDVGIAEQHAVTFAAGLACSGQKPVVAIYSTFLQRGYDQLIHDVALQNLPVLFAIDRAGIVGPDGPTHAGSFDISFLRCIPNMLIMAPANEAECRQMLSTGFLHDGPAAVRYPRGTGPGVLPESSLEPIEIGKAVTVREGKDIAILAFGSMLTMAESVAKHFDASLINMRFVKPMDKEILLSLAKTHTKFVTIEENSISGGAGSGVNEAINEMGISGIQTLNIGLPDKFGSHGDPAVILADAGLSSDGIIAQINAGLPLQAQTNHITQNS